MNPPSLPLAEPPGSLFVLRFSALGDVTHVVPVIRSIQAAWPQTAITWCVGRLEHTLLEGLPGVEFVVFDKRLGSAGSFRDLRRQIGDRRFEVLLHAQFSLRSNLASLLVRAPIRLGYDRARSKDLHGAFVNARIPAGSGQHVVDGYFSFARTLGVTEKRLVWDIPVPEHARRSAESRLPDDGPLLLLSPCSSHPLRNWLTKRYASLADYAARVHGFRVVLTGGPSATERAAGAAIREQMREPVLDLIGRDTLKEFLAMLSKAALLVTPDSGPMHMATAVGTPVLGLHAASNPQRSGPYLSRRWCVDRYDDAARKFLGQPAEALKWGTKLEFPGVMALVSEDDVRERLDAFVAAGMPKAAHPRSSATPQSGANAWQS